MKFYEIYFRFSYREIERRELGKFHIPQSEILNVFITRHFSVRNSDSISHINELMNGLNKEVVRSVSYSFGRSDRE